MSADTSSNAAKETGPVPPGSERAAVSGSSEQRLVKIWVEALGCEHVGRDENFFDLGGDSAGAASMLAAVEIAFGKRFPISALFQFPTIRQMAETLDGIETPERPASLVLIQSGDERPPLFYAPGATSGDTVLLGYSAYLTRLARRLGAAQTVYSLYQEYAGPTTSVESVAANLVRDIRVVQPAGPYHLAGWSLGGLVVFEMARQLAAMGEEIGVLAVFDTTGPGESWKKTRSGRIATALQTWRKLSLADKLLHPTDGLSGLARRCARRIRGRVKMIAETAADKNPWKRAEQIGRRYLDARHFFSGRLTLFASEETVVEARNDVALAGDPLVGWSAAAGSVEIHKLPGDHYTMFDEPGLTEMADLLRRRLPVH